MATNEEKGVNAQTHGHPRFKGGGGGRQNGGTFLWKRATFRVNQERKSLVGKMESKGEGTGGLRLAKEGRRGNYLSNL